MFLKTMSVIEYFLQFNFPVLINNNNKRQFYGTPPSISVHFSHYNFFIFYSTFWYFLTER